MLHKLPNPHQDDIDIVAIWANKNLSKATSGDFSFIVDCPKVGYIGCANAWSWAECAMFHTIQAFMKKQGLNWCDYFRYDVELSD